MQPIAFLLVRFNRLIRELRLLGVIYSTIVVGAAFMLLLFFYKSQSTQNIFIALGVVSFLIFIIHISRKDHGFLQLTVERPFVIYFVEYAMLVLPLIALSWIKSGMPLFFLILPALLLISFWNVKKQNFKSSNLTGFIIPKPNFEWKSGVRKTGIILVMLWILAMVLTPVPFASLVVLWFFLLVVSSFYEEGEPREMVECYQKNETAFLKLKIKSQLVTLGLPMVPVLLLSLFFFPERWWILLLFFIFSLLNLAVFILSKYAVWRPAEINRSGSIVNALCMLGFFLPFFLPLPIIVAYRNYRKSVHNLNPLLHDYHS